MALNNNKGSKMKILRSWQPVLLFGLMLSGCASEGPNSMGSHGKESLLSENKIEGLYLFKIETNQNVINVHSGNDAKVSI